ncbi:alginate lyase family protein [Phanerochaete sordida]|uniref:Alginate lyase family protein n=1 Tax=Phanerochaete sordida TaxID=48140 RepID=A0A9P3G176_9APHY|nr:alginate lyase family protein [Phanerochaete sordida]
MKHRNSLLCLVVAALSAVAPVHSLVDYANVFIAPQDILNNTYPNTGPANQTIISWAQSSVQGSPWTVMNKPFAPPSGDYHDYESWAPYEWADCSNVHNTTALTPEQVWQQCNYVNRDGQLNPANRVVNNIGDFETLADAVLYNSLAYALTRADDYAQNAASFVNAWFLAPDTKMNPNLNYAQMQGGPSGQVGTHTGVLDLKCMVKIVSAVLLLRETQAPKWTSDIDAGLTAWAQQYVQWLTTADIAKQERAATNNHGSFFYNQLAALQILAGDTDGAKGTIEEYFSGIYMGQIAANGDQPLESARTRPYHYRAYNLAAMITNAKLGQYVGVNAWNKTTSAGATIQAALDYAMTVPPGPSETSYAAELYPNVAAVAAVYGDPAGTYAAFLAKAEGADYVSDACFFWSQPLGDSGFAAQLASATPAASVTGKPTVGTGSPSPSTTAKGSQKQDSAALARRVGGVYGMLVGVCALVAGATLFELL